MIYEVPDGTSNFEIPDDWLVEAAIAGFTPGKDHYNTDISACSGIVLLSSIAPPLRDKGEFWFRDRQTVVSLLKAYLNGDRLEPIEVWPLPIGDAGRYKVRDGFHRFYTSIAAGFTRIPIVENGFDLEEFLERERRGL
jgi:hypothetical protein